MNTHTLFGPNLDLMTTIELPGITLRCESASMDGQDRRRLHLVGKLEAKQPAVSLFRQPVHQMWAEYKRDQRREPYGWGERSTVPSGGTWQKFSPKSWEQINQIVQRHFLHHGFDEIFDAVFRRDQGPESTKRYRTDYVALKTRLKDLERYIAECEQLADGLAMGLYEFRQVPAPTPTFRAPNSMTDPCNPSRYENVTAAVWDGNGQIGWIIGGNQPVPMKDYRCSLY